MGRLQRNYSPVSFRRYLLATIVPIILILWGTFLTTDKFRSDIDFIDKEIEGLAIVENLYDDILILQKIRGRRQLRIGGDNGQSENIDELTYKLISRLENKLSVMPHYSHDQIKEVVRYLKEVNDNLDDTEQPLRQFDQYTVIIEKLIELINTVSDNSNLTLDHNMNTHYLGRVVVSYFTEIAEHQGQIRGLMAYGIQNRRQMKLVSDRVIYKIMSYEQDLKKLKRNIKVLNNINRATKPDLFNHIKEWEQSTKDFIIEVKKMIPVSGNKIASRNVFESGTQTLKKNRRAYQSIKRELLVLLQERISYLQKLLILTSGAGGVGFLLLLGTTFILYHSNRKAFGVINISHKELKLSEIRHRTILETVADGIITVDNNGVILVYNSAAESMFGYEIKEAAGKNIEMLLPGVEIYPKEKHYEIEGVNKNGKIIPVELAANEMILDDKKMFTVVVRDITERKKMDKLKNEFIAMVSHELRTPLTSIRGSLGLINGGAVGKVPSAAQEMLQIASNNTERLLLLINDILDIQKIEAGQMAFRFQNVPLMPLVEQALRENSAYAEQYGVRYVIDHRLEEARVFCDPDRMMQVMANLLSNAAKFSPRDETVEVSVARNNDTIRISVTDHGSGIPESFQKQIFEKFTQADSSDVRNKGGTGLGLNISKLMIEKHGGHISFITSEGLGSTFYIDLPELIGAHKTGESKNFQRVAKKKSASILIVEDEPDVAMLLKRMLAEAGYNSDIAYDASQARQLLKENAGHYKLITLDLVLPGEDGVSFLNKLRSDDSTRSIPVVVISLKAGETKRLTGGAVDVIDWMQKPIDQFRLIHAIRQTTAPDQIPRVLHVEDEIDVHKVVKLMLQGHCELVCSPTLAASKEALNKEEFDLVLLDIGLPDGSGLDLLELIEKQVVPPKVVIFSAQDVPESYADRVKAILIKSQTDNRRLAEVIIGAMKNGSSEM